MMRPFKDRHLATRAVATLFADAARSIRSLLFYFRQSHFIPTGLAYGLVLGTLSSSGQASPLLTLESQPLGQGLFEYRLAYGGQPYLERNGLTEFRIDFPGFDGGAAAPAAWNEAPEFPVPPQAEASLRWIHDNVTRENLPYSCAFRARSQKASFRLGTASVRFILHWNDWAQPPDLRTNVQGTATLRCLVPCDPEQGDGLASPYQDSGWDFPQLRIDTFSYLPANPPGLGIAARTGLPLCIEASGDLQSWRRVGFVTASTGITLWPLPKPESEACQFYRATVRTPSFAHPEALATTQWLEQHLNDPDLRIVDSRYPQSDADFQSGHIPGAVKVDPNADLLDPTRRPIEYAPTAAQFQALMSRLGIGNSTTVVVYDLDGGLWCSRLWWALRYYGHQPVKLLSGGLRKWQREVRPMEKQVQRPPAAVFQIEVHPELRATLAEVEAAVGGTNVLILDALPSDRHQAGHIPSAKSVPATANLDALNYVLQLPPEKLAALYEAEGLTPDKPVITYCGGGYYGAFSLFVLYQLGYENVRLYDGSWLEWTAKGKPIETESRDSK